MPALIEKERMVYEDLVDFIDDTEMREELKEGIGEIPDPSSDSYKKDLKEKLTAVGIHPSLLIQPEIAAIQCLVTKCWDGLWKVEKQGESIAVIHLYGFDKAIKER